MDAQKCDACEEKVAVWGESYGNYDMSVCDECKNPDHKQYKLIQERTWIQRKKKRVTRKEICDMVMEMLDKKYEEWDELKDWEHALQWKIKIDSDVCVYELLEEIFEAVNEQNIKDESATRVEVREDLDDERPNVYICSIYEQLCGNFMSTPEFEDEEEVLCAKFALQQID